MHLSSYPELIGGAELEDLFLEAMELFPDEKYFQEEYERNQEMGLFEVEKLSESPTPITAAVTATVEVDAVESSTEEPPGRSLPLIMGMLFIGGGIVLLIIAIQRRAK